MSQIYTHYCRGTCSRQVTIEYDDNNKIIDVKFLGGCPGNTEGLRRLLRGMDLNEVHDRLKGTLCGNKSTSCPNELALAIEEIKNK